MLWKNDFQFMIGRFFNLISNKSRILNNLIQELKSKMNGANKTALSEDKDVIKIYQKKTEKL
jgi:hypothetical protein